MRPASASRPPPHRRKEMEDRYEELRRAVLGETFISNGLGMTILIRKGMAAWSMALNNAEVAWERQREGKFSDSCASGVRAEIITVLAGVILNCARKE